MSKRKKKLPGHYCKVCGERKSNEKFSGKGHAAHICRECEKLSPEKRNELQTINRIMNLPFWLKKDQINWLKKMMKSKNEEIRNVAEEAYEIRFPEKDPRIDYQELLYFVEEFDEDIEFLESLAKGGKIETVNSHLVTAVEHLKKALHEIKKADEELFGDDEDDLSWEYADDELPFP